MAVPRVPRHGAGGPHDHRGWRDRLARVATVEHASRADLPELRRLFEEYAESLGVDLAFQDFERELAELPGQYAPPGGALLLARVDGEPAGCVGVRPLGPRICEMKRLYVRPAWRTSGVGRALAEAAVDAGRELGYDRMRLDTLPAMEAARALYRSLGFREIEAYRYNPIPGTAYMEIELGPLGEPR